MLDSGILRLPQWFAAGFAASSRWINSLACCAGSDAPQNVADHRDGIGSGFDHFRMRVPSGFPRWPRWAFSSTGGARRSSSVPTTGSGFALLVVAKIGPMAI